MKISACYIVKNEEKNLAKSIESLNSIVDEIIVVDTGSTDNTLDIARKYQADVYEELWQDDFALHRNSALCHASGDWIIFLDADEYFINPSEVRSYIYHISVDTDYEGLAIPLVNIDPEQNDKREQFINSTSVIRIWRNCADFRYVGCVHEAVYRVDEKQNIRPLNIFSAGRELTVYHTGYRSSIVKEKLKRYLFMLNREISCNGVQPLSYRYLTDCYFGLGNYKEAAKYAQRAVDYENKMGITTMEGKGKLYRYLIESAIELKWERNKIMNLARTALQDTSSEKDYSIMKQYIKNIAVECSYWPVYCELIAQHPAEQEIYGLLVSVLNGEIVASEYYDKMITKRQRKLAYALFMLKGKQEYQREYSQWKKMLSSRECEFNNEEEVGMSLEEILDKLQADRYNRNNLRIFVSELNKIKAPCEEQIVLLNRIYKPEDAGFIAEAIGWKGKRIYLYYAGKAGLPLDDPEAYLAADKPQAAAAQLSMELKILHDLRSSR